MKALRTLLISALAAFGLAAAVDVSAQQSGVARASSGTRTGAIGNHWSGGTHSWSGSGHWSGGTRHWSGSGHWYGPRNHWYGSRIGFYFGVPVLWGAWYWGWPYYYDYGPYYYPRTIIYRDIERYPASYPDGEMGPATTEVPPSAGAPSQGPLYMNYCESAKAYYPKVTSCPEGWKFVRPGS